MRAPAVPARSSVPAGAAQPRGPRRRHIPRWHARGGGTRAAAGDGRAPASGRDAACGEPAARTAAATSSARDGGDSRPLRARAAPIERAAGAGPCARAGRGCGLSPAAAQGIEARRPSEHVRHRRRVPAWSLRSLAAFLRGALARWPLPVCARTAGFRLAHYPKLLEGFVHASTEHGFGHGVHSHWGGAAGYPLNVGDPRQAGQHRRR